MIYGRSIRSRGIEWLHSHRREPENKEAYFSQKEQTWGCVQLKVACCSSCTSSWASQSSQAGEASYGTWAMGERKRNVRVLGRKIRPMMQGDET
eukprot:1150080-Pelagomonas_calceolata.AAC.1